MQESLPPDATTAPPDAPPPALRMKLRRPPAAEAAEPGAARAWRVALARAAEAAAGLDLAVTAMTDRVVGLPDVLELPGAQALILLLDGPAGQTGLAVLSQPLLAGLVEAMTLGQVLRRPPVPRMPTRTDSAMADSLLDRALREAEELLAADPDIAWISDFHHATYLTDPRPLGFMLEDQPYRVLQADIALAGGHRTGGLWLVLPARARGRAPVVPAPPPPATPACDFRETLARHVAGAEVRLDAVIAQLTLPLGHLMSLAPGDLLPLEGARLDLVTVTAIDGTEVGLGRLGQARGGRAVRLTRVGRAPDDSAAA